MSSTSMQHDRFLAEEATATQDNKAKKASFFSVPKVSLPKVSFPTLTSSKRSDDGVSSSFIMRTYNNATFRSVMFRLFIAALVSAAVLVIVALTLNPSSLPGMLPGIVNGLAPLAAKLILVGAGAVLAVGLGLAGREIKAARELKAESAKTMFFAEMPANDGKASDSMLESGTRARGMTIGSQEEV